MHYPLSFSTLSLLSLLFLSSCSSPQKELEGEWQTHQEENGITMDMIFNFEPKGKYSVEVGLSFKGDIIRDTTKGVWRVKGDTLFMGISRESSDPARYFIEGDTLGLILDSDTMFFERNTLR